MKSNFKLLLLFVLLCGANETIAQINLGKAKDKIGLGKKKETTSKETVQPNNNRASSTNNNTVVDKNKNADKLNELKTIRTQLEKENKFAVSTYIDGKMSKEETLGGVLTFTNDYDKPTEDKIEFGGKDFVYAYLKLPKKLTEYLDKKSLSNLIYYRVKNRIKVYNEYGESGDHMQTSVIDQFEIAYNTQNILIPIVPERNYYDDVIAQYKKGDKFENSKIKQKAYLDALARIRPADALQFLAGKEDGKYIIEVNTEITAKMRGSDFKKIENLKGYFLIDMSQETRERYQASYTVLADRALYNEYDEVVRNCEAEMQEEKEKEMMAKMTPRQREIYLAMKISPEMGAIHAYQGQKVTINLKTDDLRSKSATVKVTWKDGGAGKESGGAAISVGGKAVGNRSVAVPLGSKVTVNGKTLVESVKGGETIMIYWWY
ncbi:MAG: hypothetical protein SFU27_08775 [Thermonemataceae bacterium]|nr:hypothetical protein [Thermonemataceae bacterium]